MRGWASPSCASGELGERLREIGGSGFAEQSGALITGTSASALQGLISGSLDLDKIDYLSRDARMCGVPYGDGGRRPAARDAHPGRDRPPDATRSACRRRA